MRVLYVYDGDWPRAATRVRKQTMALSEAGHEVLLLSRNEERAPRVQQEPWMEVRRLPTFPGSTLNRLLNFPFFLNPVWIGQVHSTASTWNADVIVVEDLPLAPTAIWVGALLGLPVCYDMGEVYPEFLRSVWELKRPSLVDRFVRNPKAAEAVERYVLDHADEVFVVSRESYERALTRGSIAERTSIVGNTPEDPAHLRREHPVPEDLRGLEGRPVALFTGILIFDRGIVHSVRAIERAREHIPDLVFVVVGDGPEVPRIEAEIDRLGLHDHVRLLGWKQHSTLPGYYQHASVGLLPFLDGGQIRFTLANKLFDYMGAGLPVLASDVPPMRRVVTETGAGMLAPAGDPGALASALVDLLNKPKEERAEMGKKGLAAVESQYNWPDDAHRFVQGVRRAVEER